MQLRTFKLYNNLIDTTCTTPDLTQTGNKTRNRNKSKNEGLTSFKGPLK